MKSLLFTSVVRIIAASMLRLQKDQRVYLDSRGCVDCFIVSALCIDRLPQNLKL